MVIYKFVRFRGAVSDNRINLNNLIGYVHVQSGANDHITFTYEGGGEIQINFEDNDKALDAYSLLDDLLAVEEL